MQIFDLDCEKLIKQISGTLAAEMEQSFFRNDGKDNDRIGLVSVFDE